MTGPSAPTPVATDRRVGSRGQVVVIFAGALLLLMMMVALVVDVSWYWVNSLRVQRAADAAALAGAVMLPNKASQAYTARVRGGHQERLPGRRRDHRHAPAGSRQRPTPERDDPRPDRHVLHARDRHR